MAEKALIDKAGETVGMGIEMAVDAVDAVKTAIGKVVSAVTKKGPPAVPAKEVVKKAPANKTTKKAVPKKAAKKTPAKKAGKKAPAKKAVKKSATKTGRLSR